MSARNGDKARYGRERKQKIHRRERMRALRGGQKADETANTQEHEPSLIERTARTIGSVLGSVAAQTGLGH